ncbi:response regulator transcription factor [Arthrobacter sp. HLT1-21]
MKVLIVDDDIQLASIVARGLTAEGFLVETEHDGPGGLWRATEGSFDAIVLDIMLPGMNGFVVCRELRRAGCWTPILMLTAKDGELDESEALDTGADDYLVKPFSFVVLVARLHALLRRGTRAPTPESVGNLSVDARTRRAHVGDREVPFTSREFEVLHYLIRHAGESLSRHQIIEGVWTDFFDGDPNIVEVYIGRLRRKLETHSSTARITTLRGAGYRIEEG